MIRKVLFLLALTGLFNFSCVFAQNRQADFSNYICREWKLKNTYLNGKLEGLSESQKGSRLIFWKNGKCETTTNGQTQKKTWRYNSKKERIELKDSASGQMLYMKILDMQKEMLTLSFEVKKKKIVKIEIVPISPLQ